MDLSADGDADETVTLRNPEAGTYVAYVNGFATPAVAATTGASGSSVRRAAGNLTVTPASVPVTVGQKVA